MQEVVNKVFPRVFTPQLSTDRKSKFLRPDTHNRATPLSSAHPHSAALSQQRRLTRTAGRHRRTNSKRSGSRARWRQEDARARHASRQLRAQRAGQGHAPYQRAHARRSRTTVGVGIGWEPSARRHATAQPRARPPQRSPPLHSDVLVAASKVLRLVRIVVLLLVRRPLPVERERPAAVPLRRAGKPRCTSPPSPPPPPPPPPRCG